MITQDRGEGRGNVAIWKIWGLIWRLAHTSPQLSAGDYRVTAYKQD